MTLAEYLELQCQYLFEAVQRIPSKGELTPIFAAQKGDATVTIPNTLLSILTKSQASELFRAFLQSVEAEQYAVIIGGWYVAVSEHEVQAASAIVDREGTGTIYRNRRTEAFFVIVGDYTQTIDATFNVARDYKGKIRSLVRVTQHPPSMWKHFGDLLLKRTVH